MKSPEREKRDAVPPAESLLSKHPALIFLVIALTVFAAEALVMLLLHYLPRQSFLNEAMLDATLVVVLISPALYFFLFLPMVTHIRERAKIEETLRQNEEEQFKIMIRTALDGFWVTDVRGRFLEVNDAYAHMMGYSRAELLKLDVSAIEAAETPKDTARHIGRLLETGSDRFETRQRAKDGRILDMEVNANYSERFGGRIYCFLRDITERKRAEEELKLSAQILDGVSDTVFLLDLEGNFVYLNEAAWKSRGYTRDEMMRMNLRALDTAKQSDLIESRMKTLMENGQSVFESAHRCKNGPIMQVEINARVIESGGRKLLLSVIRDITERKRSEIALHESEEKIRFMSAYAQDALIMMDDEGKISFWNAAAEKTFGYSAQEVMGKELHAFIAPARYYDAFKKVYGHFRATGEGAMIGQTGELMAMRRGSVEFPVELSLAALKLKNRWHAVGIVRDITKRKQDEEKLRMSEARLQATLDNSPYMIWQKDLEGRYIACNQIFAKASGQKQPQDVLGKTDLDLWPQGLAEKYRADDKEVISTRRQKVLEELTVTDGQEYWVETCKTPIVDKNGYLFGTTGFAQDITARKQVEGQMDHLAHYDALTGLPNRRLFSDRLQQAIATAKRDKAPIALLFLDLDKFKPVNDELGHDVGDLLLKEVGKRLQNCVRESDTVARIGGDEFVVLLSAIEAGQDAMLVADKILYALNLPFELAGHSIGIAASVGVAVYPEHGSDEKMLTKNADIAMYNAKSGGRNCARLYHPDMVGW